MNHLALDTYCCAIKKVGYYTFRGIKDRYKLVRSPPTPPRRPQTRPPGLTPPSLAAHSQAEVTLPAYPQREFGAPSLQGGKVKSRHRSRSRFPGSALWAVSKWVEEASSRGSSHRTTSSGSSNPTSPVVSPRETPGSSRAGSTSNGSAPAEVALHELGAIREEESRRDVDGAGGG